MVSRTLSIHGTLTLEKIHFQPSGNQLGAKLQLDESGAFFVTLYAVHKEPLPCFNISSILPIPINIHFFVVSINLLWKLDVCIYPLKDIWHLKSLRRFTLFSSEKNVNQMQNVSRQARCCFLSFQKNMNPMLDISSW